MSCLKACSRVLKLERKTAPQKFAASTGEHIRDVGERTMPIKANDGIHRCTTSRSASVVKSFILMQNVLRVGNICGAG